MNIGLLNTRIQIQKSTETTDAIGNHKLTWADYYNCAATIGSESGSNTAREAETVETANAAFTVRYCSEIAAMDTLNYRIIWQDTIYDITAIDHQNNKRRSVKIWVSEVRR